MTAVAPQPTATAVIVVYAEDCIVLGSVAIGDVRLSDVLNDRTDHLLADVAVVSLDDGHRVELPELVVEGSEILAVDAAGPRGNPGRRRRTRQHPIVVRLGPYTVRGYVHALPGADPLASFARRPAFVPLTDAWLEWDLAGQTMRQSVATLLVNREAADAVDTVRDDEVAMPDLPVATPTSAQAAKDFTYEVLVPENEPYRGRG